jgi:hypothetical protein
MSSTPGGPARAESSEMSSTASSRTWRDWSSSTKIFVAGGVVVAIAVVTFLYT